MTALAVPLGAWAASPAPVEGRGGMVVSSSSYAAEAGARILAEGGNAVDAAVATAFALAVTQPFSAGLGGGAFLLIRLPNGEVVALDAREEAPAAATRDMYLAEGLPPRPSLFGPLAVAVPGFVPGLALALERWGNKKLEEVLQPAIELAEDGFAIPLYHAKIINRSKQYLKPEHFPETTRIQFAPAGGSADGKAYAGTLLVQKDMAETLRAIAKHGASIMSEGDLGQAMAAEAQKRGGILTAKDIADYRPKVRKAVKGTYRGYTVHSFPPPSSGGAVLIETLNILEGYDLGAKGALSSKSIHVIAEAMKLAFADRAAYMGDTDFVDVPVERIVSKAYGEAQRARIDLEKASVVAQPGQENDDAGTAHLSVTDSAGGAVALTMTINTPFGSGITVPGTGIILNNEMDDFSVAPDTPNAYGLVDTHGANSIVPGKRPLSSMTPTIVSKDGQTFMVTGSPGGPRIITTTLLTILNVIDYGMNAQEAVSVPRFHHQWIPDKLRVEPELSLDVIEALRSKGHDVDVSKRHWSAAEAIVIDPKTGKHYGGADPRTQGRAVGR